MFVGIPLAGRLRVQGRGTSRNSQATNKTNNTNEFVSLRLSSRHQPLNLAIDLVQQHSRQISTPLCHPSSPFRHLFSLNPSNQTTSTMRRRRRNPLPQVKPLVVNSTILPQIRRHCLIRAIIRLGIEPNLNPHEDSLCNIIRIQQNILREGVICARG